MAERSLALQSWEQAEKERSSVEAQLTTKSLAVSRKTLQRYAAPPAETAYPLEYAFHLLGDVDGQRIVDFGCGSGENTVLLSNRGAHVWALDISEALLRLGQERLAVSGLPGDATFVAASAHDMPFPDNSIDVVFGMAILHHLDLDLVSREVHRVLKPGGRGIFKEPVRNSRAVRFVRSLIPYRAPDISPFERPLLDTELERFASRFREHRVRAFGLPFVPLGEVLPFTRRYWRSIYAWDRRVLSTCPWLERYAGVRVLEVTK